MKCKYCGVSISRLLSKMYQCQSCRNQKMREWYEQRTKDPEFRAKDNKRKNHWYHKNYEKSIVIERNSRRRNKNEIINAYGGKCECCGESNYEFLTLDHVNNDGSEHRRQIGKATYQLIKWIRENNYPSIIRVLCYNCHFSVTFHDFCPHKDKVAHKKLMEIIG